MSHTIIFICHLVAVCMGARPAKNEIDNIKLMSQIVQFSTNS